MCELPKTRTDVQRWLWVQLVFMLMCSSLIIDIIIWAAPKELVTQLLLFLLVVCLGHSAGCVWWLLKYRCVRKF